MIKESKHTDPQIESKKGSSATMVSKGTMSAANRREILKERYVISSGKTNNDIKRIKRRDAITASIFIAPPLIIVTLFVFLSFLIGLVLTMYSGRLDPSLSQIEFVGLDNWFLLFENESSLRTLKLAVKNTVIFASLTMIFNISGALIISSILNSRTIKNKNFFMTIYFFPQLTSAIASSFIFMTIGETLFNFDFIKDPSSVLWMMIISTVWGGISGGMVTFNTAFSGVGQSEYEASSIDGAGPIRQFFSITVPALGPILAYAMITSIIGGMGVFDQAFAFSANGATEDGVLTWALLGFARIQAVGSLGITQNVGLGMVTLFILGITIFVSTRLANIIKPMDGGN